MMKRTGYFIIGLMILFSATLCSAQDLTQGVKDTILIGRLQVQQSVKDLAAKQGHETELNNITESLETQLINALSTTGVFQIVERKRKGDIELEQAFAAVAVNPNDTNAVKSLQMAGAKFAFLPQVDGYEDLTEVVQYNAIDRHLQKRKMFLSVVVQIVDTTTGELLPNAPSVQLHKDVEEGVHDSERDENHARVARFVATDGIDPWIVCTFDAWVHLLGAVPEWPSDVCWS